jgi:hypothetical protein
MTITRQELIDALNDRESQESAVLGRLRAGENLDLSEQKAWLKENYEGPGCNCPVCSQHVQLKSRKITPAMAKFLIALSKFMVPKDIGDFDVRGGDYAKLRFWDLATKTDNGQWQITHAGRQFVADKTRVAKYIYVYRDRERSRSPETVNIREAVGDAALYDELVS